MDFLGDVTGKNPPANVGYIGSIPGPGGSHMPWGNQAWLPQQRRTCFRAHKLQLQGPCSATREAIAMRSPRTAMKNSPSLLQLEKACTKQRRPSTTKNKNKYFFFKRVTYNCHMSFIAEQCIHSTIDELWAMDILPTKSGNRNYFLHGRKNLT